MAVSFPAMGWGTAMPLWGQDRSKSQVPLISVVILSASGLPWSPEDLGSCIICASCVPTTGLNIALHKDSMTFMSRAESCCIAVAWAYMDYF